MLTGRPSQPCRPTFTWHSQRGQTADSWEDFFKHSITVWCVYFSCSGCWLVGSYLLFCFCGSTRWLDYRFLALLASCGSDGRCDQGLQNCFNLLTHNKTTNKHDERYVGCLLLHRTACFLLPSINNILLYIITFHFNKNTYPHDNKVSFYTSFFFYSR